MRGLDIKNVEPGLLGLGRSDPFFELSRKNVDHKAGYVRWYVYVPPSIFSLLIVPRVHLISSGICHSTLFTNVFQWNNLCIGVPFTLLLK